MPGASGETHQDSSGISHLHLGRRTSAATLHRITRFAVWTNVFPAGPFHSGLSVRARDSGPALCPSVQPPAASRATVSAAALRQIRFGRWSNRAFARSQGQAVRRHVDKHKCEHQHHRGPDSPISMRVLPEVVTRMSVIPWLGSFAFHVMRVCAHFIPIKRGPTSLQTDDARKQKKPTQPNTRGVRLRRLTR